MNNEVIIDMMSYVVNYNCLIDQIKDWRYNGIDSYTGNHIRTKLKNTDREYQAQCEVLWMELIGLFGEYGTSPRYGWIEDNENFEAVLDGLIKEYDESELLRSGY